MKAQATSSTLGDNDRKKIKSSGLSGVLESHVSTSNYSLKYFSCLTTLIGS